MSLKSLTERYARECERRNLPLLDAADLEMELVASMEGLKTQIPHMTVDQKAEHIEWLRRFQEVWERVEGEQRTVKQLCIEALRHGYEVILVHDGEEKHSITQETPLSEVVELAMAVEESRITFRHRQTSGRLTFFLVFGNSPEEVIADHTAHEDAEVIWRALRGRS